MTVTDSTPVEPAAPVAAPVAAAPVAAPVAAAPIAAPVAAPVAAATASPIPNPLTVVLDWLGSANVQKALGVAQVVLSATGTEHLQSIGGKISGMTVGGVFALGVHVVAWLRAKVRAQHLHLP